MYKRKILTTLMLAASTLAPVASHAAPAAAAPCILREHRITAVAPYVVGLPRGPVEIRQGRPTVRQLRGATVFVQAEPGLTAEWLQLTLNRHLAEMKGPGGMKDCAFDVNDVQVKVTSTGAGFGVYLIAHDPGKAQEVLRRARLLFG